MEAQKFIRQKKFCLFFFFIFGDIFFSYPCFWMLPFPVSIRPWVHIQENPSSQVMVKNTLGQLDLSILPSSLSLEWIGVLLRFGYSLILNISWKEWCLTLIFACIQKNKTIKWSILIWSRSAPGMLYVEQIWVFLKRLSSDFHFFLCRQTVKQASWEY